MVEVLRPEREAALAEWGARVKANREQAERFREAPERPDFYAPVAANFKADPRRTDEPALEHLRALVRPGETWLDIGAGGGRYALPIALLARDVVALDPSEGMLAVLGEGMAEHGIDNVRAMTGRWPMPDAPKADVCLIAHVGYDIEGIGPFLDAMEASAGRLCVAVLLARSPAAAAEGFWPPVHGEERALLPALPEFLALQLARGRLCEVRLSERSGLTYSSREGAIGFLRQQLFIEPGGEKDAKLAEAAQTLIAEAAPGRFEVSKQSAAVGVVTWAPR